MMRTTLAALPPGGAITLRHDTLLSDPRGVLTALAARLNLVPDPAALDRFAQDFVDPALYRARPATPAPSPQRDAALDLWGHCVGTLDSDGHVIAPTAGIGQIAAPAARSRARTPMRVAAYVGVMDEADLIGPCLDHLRRIGVGDIVVHDMGSTDGTREILRAREGPHLRVITSSNAGPAEAWHDSIVAAVRNLDADRVVMIDADEFVLPRDGDLPAALARARAEMVHIPRYNVVLGPEGLCLPLPPGPETYDRIALFARAEPDFRARLEQDPTLFWLRAVPLPKIAVQPGVVARFRDGMHGATPLPGVQLRESHARDILIAHAALSGYDRFVRKLDNIREVFRLHKGKLGPGFGWHWRRWVEMADRGELRAEYDRSHLSAEALARLRAEGIVQSAAELLARGKR